MNIATLQTTKSNFVQELQSSYDGKKTSLHFIIHKLSHSPLVSENEVFQVIIIGGSVYKKALVRKNGKGIEILKQEQKVQPAFQTREDLLFFLEKEINSEINILALNFAYPLEPVFEHGKLDGILLSGMKENIFKNLIGKKVGVEIENFIFKNKHKKIRISVANDTVCLLLSGLTKLPSNNLACGIVGTGLNFAFFLTEHELVNLESANFDKFSLSKTAQKIDQESLNPGKALFEKETAGAYLYKHFNYHTSSPISSTHALEKIAQDSKNSNSKLAKSLLETSAQLIACQVAGIADFKGQDMVFVMEGSLFWKGNKYKETVAETVKQLTPRKVTFVEIPNSGILGAAKLVA